MALINVKNGESRGYTKAVLELVKEEFVDKDTLIRDLLNFLSEAEVRDFVEQYMRDYLEDDHEDQEPEDD